MNKPATLSVRSKERYVSFRRKESAISQQNFGILSYIGWFLIYKICLEIAYRYSLLPEYSYYGLEFSPRLENAIIACLMQVSLVAVAPRDNKRPSTYLFTLVLLFIFFPGLSYFWLADKQLSYASALWLCGLVMVFLLRAIKVAPISWRPVPKGNSTDAAKSFLMLIFIGYIGGSLLIIAIRGGIDPRAFSFDQIYQLRAENSLSGATAYFYNAATKALFPFFLGYFLTRKRSKLWRYTFAAIVVIFQLIYYLSFGFKAFLFSVFFAMLIVFALYLAKIYNSCSRWHFCRRVELRSVFITVSI